MQSSEMPISLQKNEFCYGKFPTTFKFGSSSSAYQVEGACNLDGKGQTWWDTFCQKNRQAIIDRTRGDMGADSYRNFEQDVMLLKAMNATCYKFSISWSRILPNGTVSEINQSALDYYDDLINTLLENGIEPVAVIYHWDFPQALVDKYPNTWLDENVLNIFAIYARLCFKTFGNRVKRWVIIQDPWTHSVLSFGNGTHAPGIQGWKDGIPHNVYQNLLKAHTIVYNIYDQEFRLKQRGSVGISGNSKFIPTTTKSFELTENSSPTNVSPWTELLKNPADFVVLDHDFDASEFKMSNQDCSKSTSQIISQSKTDRGIREILTMVKTSFGNPQLLLCSNGLALTEDQLKNLVNLNQIEYFKQISNEVLKAVIIDGCNVVAFLPGTLIDCWEWDRGFTVSYGLHRVDFDHPEKPRVARSSAKYLKQLFKTNEFSKDWDIGTIALN